MKSTSRSTPLLNMVTPFTDRAAHGGRERLCRPSGSDCKYSDRTNIGKHPVRIQRKLDRTGRFRRPIGLPGLCRLCSLSEWSVDSGQWTVEDTKATSKHEPPQVKLCGGSRSAALTVHCPLSTD